MSLVYDDLANIAGDKLGKSDVPCPECGPGRKTKANQKRRVLRVWLQDENFATYRCARCDLSGYARADRRQTTTRPRLKPAVQHDARTPEQQREKARWMWQRRRPIQGTPVERYLREARGIRCDIPQTLGYLPPHKANHHPAMIAAFGTASEPEPSVLRVDDVQGVHITLLKPNGSGKADIQPNKKMIGPSAGWPIALTPITDSLGLCIAEGIEDALSIHHASGLGVWAAGSAGRLPALADKVPGYVECVTLVEDDNEPGRKGCAALADALLDRGIDVYRWEASYDKG